MQLYSQKTVEIYNLTSKTVRINSVFTKPLTSDFPWCASVSPNYISINPGDSYILENSSNLYRFPHLSPNSIPQITNWRRVLAPTVPGGNSNWSNITSNTAWILGNNQYFNYLDFSVYNGTSFNGNANIGNISFWVSTNPVSNFTYLWEAAYDNYTSGNTIIDTVVIYDI